MTIIKDKLLYSEDEFGSMDGQAPEEPTHFFEFFFNKIRERMQGEEGHEKTAFLVNVIQDLDLESEIPLYGESRLLMEELEPKSRRAAAFLKSIGFEEGDTLHMAVPTVVEFFVPVIGAFLNNGVVSAGDPNMHVENMVNQLRDTEAKVIVCCEHNRDEVQKAIEKANLNHQISVIVMRKKGSRLPLSDTSDYIFDFHTMMNNDYPDVEVEPPANLESPAIIYWSSGTTGFPKGIVHSWNHFWKMFESAGSTIWDNDKAILATMCQFHFGGFVAPLVKVNKGRTLHMVDADALGENTRALFQAVDHYKADTILVGSHHCVRMAYFPLNELDPKWNFSSVINAAPTGSNVPIDTCENLQKKFTNMNKIENIYGSTELGMLLTRSQTQAMLGPVCNGAIARIEDIGTRELLGPHQEGELVVKSNRLMLGYLKKPEENKKVLLDDGFMRTGDSCYYDEQGNLYYKSRVKDLIKVMNHHIQPIEVERVLEQHPEVIEAGVFSLPDPFYQEAITAFVRVVEGSSLTPDELKNWADERLEKYQHIRGGIRFAKDLPRGRTGKLLRRDLINMWSEMEGQ